MESETLARGELLCRWRDENRRIVAPKHSAWQSPLPATGPPVHLPLLCHFTSEQSSLLSLKSAGRCWLLIRVCHPSTREEDVGIITLVHHKPLELLRRKQRGLNFVAVPHFPSGISFFGYLFRILSAMPCPWIVVSCSSREGKWSQQGLMSPSWWHHSPGLLSLIHSFNVSLFFLPFLPLFLFWGISMCQAES